MTTPVCFTLDNLGDAADLQRGVIQTPRPHGKNPPLEQGYPALLDLFARHQVPLTCFVEGWSARQYPEYLRSVHAMGHEIGMHGWQHEVWSRLSDADVDTLAMRATETLAEALGERPRAFRAPGGTSTPHTREVLLKLGYDIDASYCDTARPTRHAGQLACIPYQWSGVDATHWLWNKRSEREAEQHWEAELDKAAVQGLPFVFIWHPHVMGINRAGLNVGDRILRYIRANPATFEVVSLRTLAEGLPQD